jgi:hypothetical protein
LALQYHLAQCIPRQPALFGQLAAPPTIMKILVAAAFVLILASLGSALVFLMRDKGKSNRTVKALAFRVGFSIALFLLILIAYRLGWIEPTGIR